MKKCLMLMALTLFCFAMEENYAPKIRTPTEEKRFVILVASYNNQKYALGNLQSIFSQKYANFKVIYTNDASTDNTKNVVLDFVANNNQEIDFTYIENTENRGAMYNYYSMVSSCDNDEIVVLLDGDDRFYFNGVLHRLNQAYADDNVWMTYGQDTSKARPKGHSSATPVANLKDGSFRKLSYRWGHLRTYYAGLFKTIPKENWMYNGEFYSIAQDIAQICFLIDRACEHVYFIPDILCDYNYTNPLNDCRMNAQLQWKFCNIILQQPPISRFYSKEEFL